MSELRAGVYGRESKAKKKSIDDQIEIGVERVEENGWKLAGTYTDGASASRHGRKVRKGWNALRSDVETGELDVVVVWEASRGDRDIETWVPFVARCRDRGVLIHSAGDDDTLDPRKASHFERLIAAGLTAHTETEKLRERTLRGLVKAAKKGRFGGGATPYGYVREFSHYETDEETGKKRAIRKQVIDEDTAPVVRRIYGELRRAKPISVLVAELNAEGVPSPGGTQWNRDTVRKIARSRAYIGQRDYQGTTYDAAWPALVDVDTFNKVEKILTEPDRKTTKAGSVKHLLSYLLATPCGSTANVRPERPGHYSAQYACHVDGCTSVLQAYADEIMRDLVIARVSRDDAHATLIRPATDDQATRDAIEELAKLERRLADAQQAWDDDLIDAADYSRKKAKLKPLIDAARTRAIPKHVPGALVDLVETDDPRALWATLTVQAKRSVLDCLFEWIAVTRPLTRIDRRMSPERKRDSVRERIEFEWRDATSSR